MHVQDETRRRDTILSPLQFTTTLHHASNTERGPPGSTEWNLYFRRSLPRVHFSFLFFFFSSSPKVKEEREKSRKTRLRGREGVAAQSSPDLDPQLRSYHRKIRRMLITLSIPTLETDYRLIIVALRN